MQIQQLRYFITLVDMHSFTEAAKECFISQPALSQQMKALEHELNVPLFNRQGRAFSITPAGMLLYQKAQLILKDMEDIKEQVKLVHANHGSTLRLGLLSSMDKKDLITKLKNAILIRTGLDLELFYGSHSELYEQFGSGLLNAFISYSSRLNQASSYIKENLILNKMYIELHKEADLQNLITKSDCEDILSAKHYLQQLQNFIFDPKLLTHLKIYFISNPTYVQDEKRYLNELISHYPLNLHAIESIQLGRKAIIHDYKKNGSISALIVDNSLIKNDNTLHPKINRYLLPFECLIACYARNNISSLVLKELCNIILEFNEISPYYHLDQLASEVKKTKINRPYKFNKDKFAI